MLCLLADSSSSWAEMALDHFDALLADHAQCELKAASSALALVGRCYRYPDFVRSLSAVAHEELEHFEAVVLRLLARGGELLPPQPDLYVNELRRRATRVESVGAARRLLDSPEQKLCDRFLVGALIEARSCERFARLVDACEARDLHDDAAFFRKLMASEARHYRLFRSMAHTVVGDDEAVAARLTSLVQLEQEVCDATGTAPTIHG